jgi:glycine cleavage system H protein
MNHPSDLHYTKSHSWVRLEGDLIVTGITDHAQDALGDLVYVEAPDVGKIMTAGEVAGFVESVKTASDIYAPIDGEVVAVNELLEEDPDLVNTDPYGDGWIYKIKPVALQDLDELLSADDYEHSID